MTPTVVICSREAIDANNFKLTCSDTSYLRTGSVFVHNEITYTVTSFKVNEELIIKGSTIITEDLITLRNPFFITDTPQGANNELSIESANLELHPFVWLLENFPTNYQDPSNQYVGQSRVRLFFLDVSENNYWLNEDHRKECVEPMRNLINQFLVDLQYKVSGEINLSASNLSLTDRVRFGVYTGDKGNTKSIFNDQLSGVEVDINIPVKKYAADNCASLALIPSPIIQHTCTGTGGGGGGTTFFTDEFRLIDRASGDQIIFNAEGQQGDVTLYSFESGAFVTEPETSNIDDPLSGAVFFFTPGLPETYQVVADHNPTSFFLTGAPASVTIDNSGLLSYDGDETLFTGTVQITAVNQFGNGVPVSVNVTISSGFAGNPRLAVSSLALNAFNDNDPLQTWLDTSGNNFDFEQLTLAEQPLVKDNVFNPNIKGVLFDGISQYHKNTALTNTIFSANGGTSGEVWMVFQFEALPVLSILFWAFRTSSQPYIMVTFQNNLIRITPQQVTETKDFAFTPTINTTYVVRVAWTSANYFEVQFEKNSPALQQNHVSAIGSANNDVFIGGSTQSGPVGGGGTYSNIKYGAVVAYDRILSQTEINENFDFINSIWT